MVPDFSSMRNGQRVEVRMHSDNTGDWYPGTVVDADREWVQLDAETYPGGQMITDEGSIVEWRALES